MHPSRFEKIVHPGTVFGFSPRGTERQIPLFVKIEWDGKRLSMTGVEGPLRNGDAMGSCGQTGIKDLVPAQEWNSDQVSTLRLYWEEYHLNDLTAGCEHQRGWDKKRIDPSKPKKTYGIHFDGQKQDSWNMWVWISEQEHPQGLLSKPCPVCGWKYGSGWLTRDVPCYVLDFLYNLPESPITPAWV